MEEMKKRKLKVSFSCMPHPFSFRGRRKEVLSILKEVGLDMIIPGLQSVDKKVLKNIKRHPEEPECLEELIKEAKKLGITTVVQFIFGLPGDSKEVFKRNLKYALKVKPHYALFYKLSKLPGSEIEREFKEKSPSGLSEEYVKKWVKRCQSRFFLDPRIIFQNFFHILSKNPKWFLIAGKNLAHLSKATGIN